MFCYRSSCRGKNKDEEGEYVEKVGDVQDSEEALEAGLEQESEPLVPVETGEELVANEETSGSLHAVDTGEGENVESEIVSEEVTPPTDADAAVDETNSSTTKDGGQEANAVDSAEAPKEESVEVCNEDAAPPAYTEVFGLDDSNSCEPSAEESQAVELENKTSSEPVSPTELVKEEEVVSSTEEVIGSIENNEEDVVNATSNSEEDLSSSEVKQVVELEKKSSTQDTSSVDILNEEELVTSTEDCEPPAYTEVIASKDTNIVEESVENKEENLPPSEPRQVVNSEYKSSTQETSYTNTLNEKELVSSSENSAPSPFVALIGSEENVNVAENKSGNKSVPAESKDIQGNAQDEIVWKRDEDESIADDSESIDMNTIDNLIAVPKNLDEEKLNEALINELDSIF